MDYEQLYKDALETGRALHKNGAYRLLMEEIFPQLKESEDERMKQAILGFLEGSGMDCELIPGIKIKDAIAWLEKQESVEEIVERCKNSWYNEGKIAGQFEGLSDEERYQQGWHDALEKKGEPFDDNIITRDDEILQAISVGLTDAVEDFGWSDFGGLPIEEIQDWLEKQSKDNMIEALRLEYEKGKADVLQDANYPNGCIVLEDFNGGEGFYKLNLDYLNKKQVEEVEEMVRIWNKESKASNDNIKSCIGMCLTDADEQRFKDYNTSLKEVLAWLEKKWNDSYLQEKIENFTNAHKGEDPEGIIATCRGGEKQGEKTVIGNGSISASVSDGDNSVTSKEVVSHYPTVTTSTTIEPKFKVGDWVVSNYIKGTTQITSIQKDGYTNSNNGFILFKDEKDYHHWATEDAKEGDVLYSKEHNLLWIYKDKEAYHACINLNYGVTSSLGGVIVIPNDTCPATKEQRDLLFAKMKEEGCGWDADKKELIKVELTEWIPKNGDVVRLKNDNGQRWTISLSAEPDTYEKWFLSLNTKDGVAGSWVSDYLLKENYTFVNNPLEEAKNACKEETTKLGKALAEAVKPTKWSEEDVNNICTIQNIICSTHHIETTDEKCKLLDWLKSLKERMKGE